MMPNWKQCLQAIVLLSIVGFALVIVSGFWRVLGLLLVVAAVAWFFWANRTANRPRRK
jgi:hypothetical protein